MVTSGFKQPKFEDVKQLEISHFTRTASEPQRAEQFLFLIGRVDRSLRLLCSMSSGEKLSCKIKSKSRLRVQL